MPPFMQPHAPPHMMQYAPGAMPMSHQSMPMANGWPMAHANGMHMLPHPGPFYMLPANLGPDGQAMPMFYPDPRLGPPPTAFPLEGPPGSPVMLHPPYGGFPPGVSSPEHHMMMMQQQKHWHDMQQVSAGCSAAGQEHASCQWHDMLQHHNSLLFTQCRHSCIKYISRSSNMQNASPLPGFSCHKWSPVKVGLSKL